MMLFDKYRGSYWFIYLLFLYILLAGSCKSTEKAKEDPAETKYEFHCSESDYLQSGDNFRVHKIGESVDQPTSLKKGIKMAQQDMAGSIETSLNKTIEHYLSSNGLQIDETVKDQIAAITKPIGEELIEKVNVICEESIKTLNGLYRTYVVLEISANEVLNELEKKMKDNTLLEVSVNSAEFKEMFEHQMNKNIQKQEN